MSAVLIAFDFGLRRIGVAAGNTLTGTATPLTTLHAARGVPWRAIDDILFAWRPARIVVGLPIAGGDPETRARIARFVHDLQIRYKLPVATVDEGLTSRAARSGLAQQRQRGLRKKRTRKHDIDKYAACLIAEQWMNETAGHG
jgi:putative Holliday junction resolvase